MRMWRPGERSRSCWRVLILVLVEACSRSEQHSPVAEPPPSRSIQAPPPAPVEPAAPAQRKTVDVGTSLAPGDVQKVAPTEPWTKLQLSEGTMVEIRTEQPGAVLDKLGVTTLTISHQAEHFAVNGLEAILGDIGALVARARGHEETDAFVEEVAKTPSAAVFAVSDQDFFRGRSQALIFSDRDLAGPHPPRRHCRNQALVRARW